MLSDQSFPNLEVIRKVLADMGGNEVAEFSNGNGAGNLHWSHQDGTFRKVRIAIPLRWLSDPEMADKVEEAARHFATGVRVDSSR